MAETIKGLSITIGADTKQFNKEMRAVDRNINHTNRQVNELQKSLELEFDDKRFTESQRLAQEAIQKTDLKAKALREQMQHLEETGSDKSSDNYQKLQTELVRTEARAVVLKNKLEEINQLKVEHLAKQFEAVGEGISKAGKALAPFSAVAAGALAGITATGLSTVKSADDLKTFADMVNMSAEELQRWQYIAMQVDVSNSDLQTGLTKTQAAFGKLAKGELDKTSQALLNLGFTSEKASQGMSANFDTLVATLASIKDPMLQAAYANEIFGQNMGTKLIPMLQAGGEGLAILSKEFDGFDTLTNKQVESLAEFDNVMNRIKYSLKTIKDQIGAALLPVMETLASIMNDKIVPAFRNVSEWFTNLSDGQKHMLVSSLAIVSALAPVLLIVGKLTSGIGGLIKSISGVSQSLTSLMANPIVAVIAAIAALLIYLYSTNEQFRESINGLINTLGDALFPILTLLGNIISELVKYFMPLIEVIGNYLATGINNLMAMIEPLIHILSALLMPILSAIPPIIKIMSLTLIPLMSLIGLATKALAFFGQIFSQWFEGIPKVVNDVLSWIEKKINWFIDFVNKVIREINKLSKFLGFTISEMDNVTLSTSLNKMESKGQGSNNDVSSATEVLSQTPIKGVPNVITNNDYSNKDIQIVVTVENYAEKVDVDDMVRQINLKLAEQM